MYLKGFFFYNVSTSSNCPIQLEYQIEQNKNPKTMLAYL